MNRIISISLFLIALAHPASAHRLQIVTVPFVGCPSMGMADQGAPSGQEKFVRLPPSIAARLTYYETADGLGRLGPRGWHCQGQNGNASYEMYLTPNVPASKEYPFDDVRLTGPAIEFSELYGEGSSSTTDHAELAGRYFPFWRSIARRRASFEPEVPPPSLKPFRADRTLRHEHNVVVIATPPHSEGLGTFDKLGPGQLPVISKLTVKPYYAGNFTEAGICLVTIRLPRRLRDLLPVILNQVGHSEHWQ